ncbi:MAG: radical SAM protein [Planctomycetes bacterium]|nr:radical SAM protein [Planctomycetota bacterium]
MKILLVQSYLKGDVFPPVYPLGISYVASFLSRHEVRIYDPNLSLNPTDDLTKVIQDYHPQVIGISLRNIDNQSRKKPLNYYGDFQDLLHTIKKTAPSAHIIVGGTGFSMFAREIMDTNSEINYGVYLEGEETLSELVDNLDQPDKVKGVYYRKNGTVCYTGSRMLPQFEKFPAPRRDIVNPVPYKSGEASIGIQTQRGCPLHCAYCNYPALNGNRLRSRSPENVVNEVEALVHTYGIQHFMFADSLFNRPLEHAAGICKEIIRRNLQDKINWMCWLDVRGVTKDFLHLLKNAGCSGISFSPDGLSTSSLTSLGKGIKERDVWNLLKLIATDPLTKDIKFIITMFINSPGETYFGMIKMLFYKFVSLIVKKILKRNINVQVGWIRLEPDTEIYNIAIKQEIISPAKSLLPANTDDIKNLFYLNPSLKFLDIAVLTMASIAESVKGKIKQKIIGRAS